MIFQNSNFSIWKLEFYHWQQVTVYCFPWSDSLTSFSRKCLPNIQIEQQHSLSIILPSKKVSYGESGFFTSNICADGRGLDPHCSSVGSALFYACSPLHHAEGEAWPRALRREGSILSTWSWLAFCFTARARGWRRFNSGALTCAKVPPGSLTVLVPSVKVSALWKGRCMMK